MMPLTIRVSRSVLLEFKVEDALSDEKEMEAIGAAYIYPFPHR
jgi:hypothetical protein